MALISAQVMLDVIGLAADDRVADEPALLRLGGDDHAIISPAFSRMCAACYISGRSSPITVASMCLKEHEIAALRRWRAAILNYRPSKDGVIALGTLLTAVGTILLALFALRQANITADQLTATRLESRPWIALDLDETAAHFALVPDGLDITLRFKLSNTGKLPARAVYVQTQAWPTAPHLPAEADQRRKEACPDYSAFGAPIFPGQTIEPPIEYGTTLRWEDMNKVFAQHPSIKEKWVIPYVIACATYVDLEGITHRTPLQLDVRGIKANQPGSFAVDVNPNHFANQHLVIGPDISYRMDPD